MSYVLFIKPHSNKKNRNVVRDFVYGCWCSGKRIGGMQMPPLNDIYCATHVRNAGIDVKFLDAQLEPKRYKALKQTRFEGVMAVVMLSSTQSFRNDLLILADIKKLNPWVKSILYGSHPTFMPQYCLNEEMVDFIVLREPEETLRCLLLALKTGKPTFDIEGIGYRDKDKKHCFTPLRPFIDMDELPVPDRMLMPPGINYFNPVVKAMPYTTIQTSRGCPGRCIFCTAPTFYGRKYRFRSAAKVIEELALIKEQGFREVFFRDEVFTAFKARNLEICDAMISRKLQLSWIANARVDMIDKESITAMKKAGCHMLKFGVESGSNEILNNYNKGINIVQTESAFRIAREAGIDTHAHIVLGGPGETVETIRRTIAFAKKIRASTASFGILTPYPGTELFDRVAKHYPEIMDGSGSNMDNLHTKSFFSEGICGISSKELSRYIVKAYSSFYLRPGYLWGRFTRIESLKEFLILIAAGAMIFEFSLTGEN